MYMCKLHVHVGCTCTCLTMLVTIFAPQNRLKYSIFYCSWPSSFWSSLLLLSNVHIRYLGCQVLQEVPLLLTLDTVFPVCHQNIAFSGPNLITIRVDLITYKCPTVRVLAFLEAAYWLARVSTAWRKISTARARHWSRTQPVQQSSIWYQQNSDHRQYTSSQLTFSL